MKLGRLQRGRPAQGAAIPAPGGPGRRRRPRHAGSVRGRPAATRKQIRGAHRSAPPDEVLPGGCRITVSSGERPGNIDGEERRRVLSAMLRDERWAREAPPARSGSQGVADAAQEIEEEIVKVATLERRRRMLAEADTALRRLAAGRYGLCADCGKPIPLARLHALPFAIRCRPCQERLEWRTRAGGAPGGGPP